jgi:hypothetical protein
MSVNGSSTLAFADEADRLKYEEVRAIARPNVMLEKMKAGGLALVHTMSIARSIEIVGMAKFAGYDGLSINLEHERNSFGETVDMCCAALMTGWVAAHLYKPQWFLLTQAESHAGHHRSFSPVRLGFADARQWCPGHHRGSDARCSAHTRSLARTTQQWRACWSSMESTGHW